MFELIVETSSLFFSSVGAIFIIYGELKLVIHIFLLEVLNRPYDYNHIRRELTDKIVFGLEFFIAADVLGDFDRPTT